MLIVLLIEQSLKPRSIYPCYNQAMELHTCLWNEVEAFSFTDDDLKVLHRGYPELRIRRHEDIAGFLAQAHLADIILAWDFQDSWYRACPKLQLIFTPAAGDDWIQRDPNNRVNIVHGTFHGQILAESLLGAILFMNHRMPEMVRNHRERKWDRNLQAGSRLLRNQHVLIIGIGNIGLACAQVIKQLGAEVIGIRRSARSGSEPGIRPIEELDALIPWADHVVLLLPATPETDSFMDRKRLSLMKPGAYIYNFGRGNALATSDLLASLDHLGGAFLDVLDEEPLPDNSALWHEPKVMITPHSSCVYEEYRSLFIAEVGELLKTYL